jgi:hypothetical protein
LYLEHAQVGSGGAVLQIVGLAQLRDLGARLLQRLLVLFLRDTGQQFGAQDVQFGAAQRIFGHGEVGRPLRLVHQLLGLLLLNLREEIPILVLAIARRLDLRGAVELDQQLAALHARPALGQADDDELSRCPAKARRRNRLAADWLDEAVEAQRPRWRRRRRLGVPMAGHGGQQNDSCDPGGPAHYPGILDGTTTDLAGGVCRG